MHSISKIVALLMLVLAQPAFADSPTAMIGRGVASGMETIGGSGLWHMGPSVAFQRGQLNVAFAVIRKPRRNSELLYLILYKDPTDDDRSAGIGQFEGRSNDQLVDVTHRLEAGGQRLTIAYKIQLDRDSKKVTSESLTIGKIDVDPDKGRVFLADFSTDPFTLRQVDIRRDSYSPAFNRGKGMDKDLPAPNPRLAGDKIADHIFGTVESLKQRSLAVRSFLADEPHASPVAQSSGDPRNLSPAEVRSIWDVLVDVEVPTQEATNRLEQTPFTSGTPAKELDKGRFRTSYGDLDLYLAARQAEMASDLGLRAWSVDFEGGPLHVWWEVEKEGDVAVPLEARGVISDQFSIFGICKAPSGRMIFWYLPGVNAETSTDRGQQLLDLIRTKRRFASSIAHRFALHVVDGPTISRALHIPETSGPWFWGEWNGVKFKRHSEPGPFKVTGETTLLDIEAIEQNAPKDTPRRRVRLKLKAKPME